MRGSSTCTSARRTSPYADDTFISGANTQCINRLLHTIERHSTYFGLKPKYDKCVNLTASQPAASVRFAPQGPAAGRLVPRQKSASYLGTLLSDTFDNKAEVANRLGDCIGTCNAWGCFGQDKHFHTMEVTGIQLNSSQQASI